MRSGRLSAEQAEAVADAASADPESEQRLLGEAKRQSLPDLREECRRTKASADPDREATARRLRAARCLKRFTDGEGAYNLRLRTTPEDGARVDAALAPVVDRLRADAKRAGCTDPVEALGADAVVEAIVGCTDEGARPSRAAESKVIALVDVDALRRGSTEGEERCDLAGVGPVAVSTVRAMLRARRETTWSALLLALQLRTLKTGQVVSLQALRGRRVAWGTVRTVAVVCTTPPSCTEVSVLLHPPSGTDW